MNVWPVIERELRTESRSRATYFTRMTGAVLAIGVLAVLHSVTGGIAEEGTWLFSGVNMALQAGIWIVVPLMAADCVSRERREGTLGLLFLTPLNGGDIVVGKSITHALRASTLILAALPVVGITFLMGGVSMPEAIRAVLMLGGSLMAALAAGLAASMRSTEWLRSQVTAGIFAILLLGMIYILSGPLLENLGLPYFVCALILFASVVRLASIGLRQRWQREAADPPQPRWVRIFSGSDFWRSVFKWNKGATLDRNPMAWLQEYSWTARLTKWGCFFAVLLLEPVVLLVSERYGNLLLGVILGLVIALSAANSFRKERQTGALELILVTPLQAGQLVWGRLWGFFCHFFPALLMYLFVSIISVGFGNLSAGSLFSLVASFVAVSVVGLYFSLFRIHFMVAWIFTLMYAVAVPFSVAFLLQPDPASLFIAHLIQLGIVVATFRALHQNIENRRFVIHA